MLPWVLDKFMSPKLRTFNGTNFGRDKFFSNAYIDYPLLVFCCRHWKMANGVRKFWKKVRHSSWKTPSSSYLSLYFHWYFHKGRSSQVQEPTFRSWQVEKINANSVDRTQDLQITWPKFFLQSGALPTELNPLTICYQFPSYLHRIG